MDIPRNFQMGGGGVHVTTRSDWRGSQQRIAMRAGTQKPPWLSLAYACQVTSA